MPGSLVDSSVWVAAVFPPHPHHATAQRFLAQATPRVPAVFCRATQQSLLRLLTTPALLRAYAAGAMTNRSAWTTFELLRSRPGITVRDEPAGTAALWPRLAVRESASAKVWMDAYLDAFAIAGGLELVTRDRDFQVFVGQGLRLRVLGHEP